jgi:hypothetical protein
MCILLIMSIPFLLILPKRRIRDEDEKDEKSHNQGHDIFPHLSRTNGVIKQKTGVLLLKRR